MSYALAEYSLHNEVLVLSQTVSVEVESDEVILLSKLLEPIPVQPRSEIRKREGNLLLTRNFSDNLARVDNLSRGYSPGEFLEQAMAASMGADGETIALKLSDLRQS